MKCALKAVGVTKEDEVITQAFNFVGTVEAIIDCGAKPIICGIDSNLHMDLKDLKKNTMAHLSRIIPQEEAKEKIA